MKIKKKWLVIVPVLIAAIVFIAVYLVFNGTDENSFTSQDTNWIKNNKNSVIDISVVSDYPVFGDGVFKEFITSFHNATGFDFNTTSILKESENSSIGYSFKVVKLGEQIGKNDLFLQEDVYILYGAEKDRIDDFSTIDNKTIGVLAKDSDEVMYYLKKASTVKYKPYDESDKLFEEYEDKKVDYIIVPYLMYLNKTINNDKYNVKYVFPEISRKIVLSLPENANNAKMNTIFTKYFNNWKENKYIKVYNNSLLNYYIKNFKINDKDKTEALTKTYVYGYVENYPYEVKDHNGLSGIAAEYISRMERLGNSKIIEYKRYDSVDKLKKAIEAKEVDIYFNYFDYEDGNYNSTISPFIEKYTVLSKVKNNNVVNSFESMKGLKLSILTDNSVYNFFKDTSKAQLVPMKDINELLAKSEDNLIVVDKEVYSYYRNTLFREYEVLYEDTITSDYNFMVKKDDTNTVFYQLFNYLIGTNSYFNYRNTGLNNLNMSILEKSSFEEFYTIALGIVFIPLIVIFILFLSFRHRRNVKAIKKEERRKYTDILTSLKNRNYLTLNTKAWNESKVYPKSVIVVDLNSIKYVNDNYGYEQGDKLITGAAGILINSQLENSEIIRTDGNEFLIYLVGYSENQIATYAKKLKKEFKGLPYNFGAAIGYSMIVDEIKTIDDAINEATLEMRNDKEENR